MAPNFQLESLNGQVYYFAPWCSICRASAPNFNDLRSAGSDKDSMIFTVAQSYQSIAGIESFVIDLDLKVPVLIGTD